MNESKVAEMDFDAWMKTAKEDPQAFEAMRLAAIEDVIGRAPAGSRDRLRRLQWRIDQERRLAKTPMHACIRLSQMMWRNVAGPGGLQERFAELQRILAGEPGARPMPAQRMPAEVIPLARAAD